MPTILELEAEYAARPATYAPPVSAAALGTLSLTEQTTILVALRRAKGEAHQRVMTTGWHGGYAAYRAAEAEWDQLRFATYEAAHAVDATRAADLS